MQCHADISCVGCIGDTFIWITWKWCIKVLYFTRSFRHNHRAFCNVSYMMITIDKIFNCKILHLNVVIFAGGNFREKVFKTFHVGVIFTILLLFPHFSHMGFIFTWRYISRRRHYHEKSEIYPNTRICTFTEVTIEWSKHSTPIILTTKFPLIVESLLLLSFIYLRVTSVNITSKDKACCEYSRSSGTDHPKSPPKELVARTM